MAKKKAAANSANGPSNGIADLIKEKAATSWPENVVSLAGA